MNSDDTSRCVDAYLDKEFFLDCLFELITVPTDVPLGPDTLMEPDHPKLVHLVQSVIRPMLQDAGIHNILELPRNQLAVRMGSGRTGESLLVQAYTPTQHKNLHREPWVPRIRLAPELGVTEPAVFGQGVSQNKVHLAAAITMLKALVESGLELGGLLYFAVNNEGRSSHDCSEAIIGALEPRPRQGLILIGTGLDISIGNRGRVDVHVHLKGRATHSSRPWGGHSAIDGANEVINRIRAMKLTKKHPLLGGQHAVVYQVVYWPVAPHTLPACAKLIVDRRLLPGDDIDEAVQEIREAIGDLSPFEVTVDRGVHMLPALVDPGEDVVTRLVEANREVRGTEPTLLHGPGSFDAGGPCAMGIPTVMWGASGGDGLLGEDFVTLSAAWDEVRVLSRLVTGWLK